MPRAHLDEKAFNTELAAALAEHNRVAVIKPETSGTLRDLPGKRGSQPDVTVTRAGRERVLLENKYDNNPESQLTTQCEQRLERHWSNGRPVRAVVGVLTPARMATSADVATAIRAASDFRWAAWTADDMRLPETGWLAGTAAELAGFIDRVGAEASDTEQYTRAVMESLDASADLITSSQSASEAFGAALLQQPGVQTNRMAMAVMFNAVVFQSHIAKHHPDVDSPSQMVGDGIVTQGQVLQEWAKILDINYWPIFGISVELLRSVDDPAVAKQVLDELFGTADKVAAVPGSQGLVGRIFGELIADRKFLATFYTLPSSAALLAEMATERLTVNDWGNREEVAALQVADMACGTGALLTAGYSRLCERHMLAGGTPSKVHCQLIEESMIGCDIMPSAVHLTAARLSGEHPDIDYTCTRTWVMHYGLAPDVGGGKPVVKLGTLDLLHTEETPALFGDGSIVTAAKGQHAHTIAAIDDESVDLVIMNPPFTRPTNHEGAHGDIPNPAFAGMGTDAATQKKMSSALKRLTNKIDGFRAGDGNAGLASNFVDLAHAKLKPGGVLALVLPAVSVSGDSWEQFRIMLSELYEDVTITTISSTPIPQGQSTRLEKTARAFSADTGMGEALVVARKLRPQPEPTPDRRPAAEAKQATFVSLIDRPRSIAEGVETARAITRPRLDAHIRMGNEEIGWAMTSSLDTSTGHPSGVSTPEVAHTAAALLQGRLHLPPSFEHSLPIATLASLGYAGPVHRDIDGVESGKSRGPFTIVELKKRTSYKLASRPVLWRHDAKQETALTVLPCSTARIRTSMQDQADRVWAGGYRTSKLQRLDATDDEDNNRMIAGATKLHINTDFDVTSQPLGACLTPVAALGGRAWPSFAVTPPDDVDPHVWEKALCVWLNTTIGLVGRWWVSSRQQLGRINLTVTTLDRIPVLDLTQLDGSQIDTLAVIYDDFDQSAQTGFLPANQAHKDPTRIKLDTTVLCNALGLSAKDFQGPLATLRYQWCSEPWNS